mgnify:CR=1 FL=1
MSKITGASVFIPEGSAAATDVAGSSQIWTKSDTPSSLYHTDDAGNDYRLGGSTLGTEIDLTSATTFTGIPAGVNWIDVSFRDVSTDGTGDWPAVQLGIASGIVTSGYAMTNTYIAPSISLANHTDAFRCGRSMGAGTLTNGIIFLRHMSGNMWVMMGMNNDVGNTQIHFGVGKLTLGGTCTQLKIDPDGNTFDDGDANILYG